MIAHTATFDEVRAIARQPPNSDLNLPVRTAHPRIVLYAATHGIAAGIAGGSAAAMKRMVDELVGTQGPLHDLSALADSDLKLYDLALDRSTRDSRFAQAIDEAEAARAAAYGMMAVEPGIDAIVVAALGTGAALAGRVLLGALLPGAAGPLERALIDPALVRHGGLDDPLDLLAALGGPDIAAILGIVLAARLAGIPVILDGIGAFAAAAVVSRLGPDLLAHCRFSTKVTGGIPVARLGLEPILTIDDDPPITGAKALIAIIG